MPKSRVELFKEVLGESEFCGCPTCIQFLAENLDEAANTYRTQFRGRGPSAVDELKSTPEGLAAYNRAKADAARTSEIIHAVIDKIYKRADHLDALTITHQDRTVITILQIKREALIEVADHIQKEGIDV